MPTSTTIVALVAAAVAWTATAAVAQQPPPAAEPQRPKREQRQMQKPGGAAGQVVAIKATVEAIDHKTRMVTLKGEGGDTVTFRAGPRVKNLGEVQVGDEVLIRYYEAVAFDVKKAGTATPGTSVQEEVKRTPPGQKPAGVAARRVTVTGTIDAIDKQAQTVTLKGPDGKTKTIKARNPENLDKVAVGDQVEISYTEAVAISVDKPARK